MAQREFEIRAFVRPLIGGVAVCLIAAAAHSQGFPNIARTPGELLAGPIAPEQGRTAIVAWHGERIVSVPEAPGSQPGADLRIRVVDLTDLDGAGPDVTVVPASASGFHAHGYFHSGAHLYIGPHCLSDALNPCNGTYPHDVWGDSFRIGGSGTAIGGSVLRRASIEGETGLLLGSYQRAGAQSPWGLNDFWTYNTIEGDAWLAVRRNNDWVYDWNNGGAPVGPAITAMWDHLGQTGVTGFPFIIGNILLWVSDQAGSGVASYDISDLSNPVLLDLLKEGNPGGYWPEIYGHYIFFPRRDGEGGTGSHAGFMVVDFSDPTDLKIAANRNLEGSNQYVTFQDEFAFMNRYKIDMRTFEVAQDFELIPGVIDTSQFALPVGNLLVTGGYGSDGPGLAVWAHQAAPDTRGPFVAYHIPRPDQTNFPVACPITLSIPETLKTETIVNGSSLILRPVGGAAVATWHAFGQGKLLTVTPQQPLLPNTTYEFVLTSAIEDAAGNGLEPYTFRFSTGGALSGGNHPPSVGSLTVTPDSAEPGELVTFSWTGSDSDGDPVEYRIDFGDGSPRTEWSSGAGASHTYTEPGHYQITIQIRDDNGALSAVSRRITVLAPPSAPGSTASSPILYDAGADRVFTVNPDNDSVSAIDGATYQRLWEAPVGRHPAGIAQAADGALWVACRDSDEIRILDPANGGALFTLPLGYGARPAAIAATPNGQAILVSLEGFGALARFHAATRIQSGLVELGPWPRAIAVTHDGARALVTRFVSGEHAGAVYDVSLAGGMTLTRTIGLVRDQSVDGSASGRGVPNYLASVRIAPDGEWAWVLAKKDNTTRGTFFAENMIPGQDSTVRAMLLLIDLTANAEAYDRRLDIDNSESPSAVAFSPLGDYAFIALQGNNAIGALDVLEVMQQDAPGNLMVRWATGLAPQGIAIDSASGRLFTMDFMGRTVTATDAAAFIATGELQAPSTAAAAIAAERLHPAVLNGKRIFYNAADTRMSAEGYISCATCHIDGSHDGRTWEFTNRGEGFRNTTDLRGRSGMAQGNVHWTANFDEIQDFENDVRAFFGGSGFLSDMNFATTSETLGATKAGLSADLDDLAAYVASLGAHTVPRSPERAADGSLSDAAVRGEAVFHAQGCAVCHVPAEGFTDRLMHDVGTLRATSGQRLGMALTGIETPTLLGLHAAGPYFHDGSAAALADVFTQAGGALVQAEAAALSGGATAFDIEWFPMKEWHGGQLVEAPDNGVLTFAGILSTIGGAGYIEVRYSLGYANGALETVVNGGTAVSTPLAMTPNNPMYVATEWRVARVPVTFQAGANTITVAKDWGGALHIDDVLFVTPDDLAAASAHVRTFAPGDMDDLVAYLASLDGSDGPAPSAVVRRGAVIGTGAVDTVSHPGAGETQYLVYTIENPSGAILDIGALHAAPSGPIWIAAQPAPQVLPGQSATVTVGVALTGASASAAIQGWTSGGPIAWTLQATADGAPEPHPADINNDGAVNAVDAQLTINAALGLPIPNGLSADINGDGQVNAADVQLAINGALGIG